MQSRNLFGLVMVLLFFGGFAWLIFGPHENPSLFFGVGFGLIIVFFMLIIAAFLLIHRKSREVFNRFAVDYGLKSEENVQDSIRSSVESIIPGRGVEIDNVFSRQSFNGQLTFFDVSYWIQRHKDSSNYVERIIAFPCSFKFDQCFSIGKQLYKRGVFIEEMAVRALGLNVVSTNHVDFDAFYSLLVPDESMDIRLYVEISCRMFPTLEKYLKGVKKYPVGPTMYTCILSFVNQTGFIRYNPQNFAVEPFYNLANELALMKYN